MILNEINNAVHNAMESCERYIEASRRSLIAQKTTSDLQLLNQMHINYREEMLALYRNNSEIRNKLFKNANEILHVAILNGDVQLAEIAGAYIKQAHSLNPFI